MNASEMRLVVLGFGFSARAFVAAVRPGTVMGTTRSDERAAMMARLGVTPALVGDAPDAALSAAIRGATHLLVSAGPSAAGDPFLARYEADMAAASGLAWIGYLSTVGVYGDHQGAAIDETAPCRPSADRGIWRVAAEGAWTALGARIGVPLAIFRLAGIYGPGRNQFVSLSEGRAKRVVKPGQVFNRIHVEDIAATLSASLAQPAARIYNVADDEAAPPQEVVTFAADLMGVAPPPEVPFDEAVLSPMARSFYSDTKRVRNGRIKRELGVLLRYPTYREGLSSLWEDGTWRGWDEGGS